MLSSIRVSDIILSESSSNGRIVCRPYSPSVSSLMLVTHSHLSLLALRVELVRPEVTADDNCSVIMSACDFARARTPDGSIHPMRPADRLLYPHHISTSCIAYWLARWHLSSNISHLACIRTSCRRRHRRATVDRRCWRRRMGCRRGTWPGQTPPSSLGADSWPCACASRDRRQR